MKKTIAVVVLLLALWVGYLAWPFVSLLAVVRAAESGDVAAIQERVNFPALRRSLSGQIISTYARFTGMKLDGAGLTVGLAASLADPFIEKMLSPAALADLLRSGWPKGVLSDAAPGAGGVSPSAIGNAWRLFLNSDYGIGEVRVTVPVDQPKEKQFRIELGLHDWSWKLQGLGLPVELQERLARELMKEQGKAG